MIIRKNLNEFSAHNSKSDCEGIQLKVNGKYHPLTEHDQSNGRLTSMPMRGVDPAVTNLLYERSAMRKDPPIQHSVTWRQQSPVRSYRIPASSSSIEIKSMDFRPLITYGRRKFHAAPYSSSMIIVKKKSPCPLNTGTFEEVCEPSRCVACACHRHFAVVVLLPSETVNALDSRRYY